MSTWHAEVWSEDGLHKELTTEAKNIGAAAAEFYADTDHMDVVELNIWRDDR